MGPVWTGWSISSDVRTVARIFLVEAEKLIIVLPQKPHHDTPWLNAVERKALTYIPTLIYSSTSFSFTRSHKISSMSRKMKLTWPSPFFRLKTLPAIVS